MRFESRVAHRSRRNISDGLMHGRLRRMRISNTVSRHYFVIDSEHLDEVETHLYGYSVTEHGYVDNAAMQTLGDSSLDACGTYVFVKRFGNEITIRQDFGGDFGIFVYEDEGYFALSNSFHMLFDHVKATHCVSLNRDYCNHFLTTWVVSLADTETAISEIRREPADVLLHVDIESKTMTRENVDLDSNHIALDSREAMDALDRWHAKWTGILGNTLRATRFSRVDLSGGIDSRLTFMLALNSGVDLSTVLVNSLNDGLHTHAEDYSIASAIAEHYGFELNSRHGAEDSSIVISKDEVIDREFLAKGLFQKEPSFGNRRNMHWHYFLGGSGGENIRPYWYLPTEQFIDGRTSAADSYPNEYIVAEHTMSMERVLRRSIDNVCRRYGIDDPQSPEISFNMFRDCYSRNHFGRINVESVMSNVVRIAPIMDPLLQSVKLSTEECPDPNLLVALLFTRFGGDLLDFPFDNGRSFDPQTIRYAQRLCEKYPISESSHDLEAEGQEFLLLANPEQDGDSESSAETLTQDQTRSLIVRAFESNTLKKLFCASFPHEIYETSLQFYETGKYFPIRHIASVVAISDVLESLYGDASHDDETWCQRLERWASSGSSLDDTAQSSDSATNPEEPHERMLAPWIKNPYIRRVGHMLVEPIRALRRRA